jgi:hypothetical protein
VASVIVSTTPEVEAGIQIQPGLHNKTLSKNRTEQNKIK